MKEFQQKLEGTGLKIAIVASRYNDFITSKLVSGSHEALIEHGVTEDNIDLVWCPGALELPSAVQRIASKGISTRHYDGIIAIGCVIRGDTDHYTHVATEAVHGVSQVALNNDIAIGNAILTVENIQQATERAGERTMNKGYEAALVVIEMACLFKSMK